MKRALLRFALLGVLAGSLVPIAASQQSTGTNLPKYNYALRRLTPDGSNYSYVNWNGNLNLNGAPTQDELLVEKDGKRYRITDKATLDQFEKYFEPIRKINDEKAKFMEEYGEAKGNHRAAERMGRSLDRRIQLAEEALDRARNDDERRERQQDLADLRKEKSSNDRELAEAAKRFEPLQKKREDFARRKEALRAKVYPQTDRLIEEAINKGLATRIN